MLVCLWVQIGPNGYYFAIDPNGYVLLHPNLQPKVRRPPPLNADCALKLFITSA